MRAQTREELEQEIAGYKERIAAWDPEVKRGFHKERYVLECALLAQAQAELNHLWETLIYGR